MQTDCSPEALDKTLRRLAEIARGHGFSLDQRDAELRSVLGYPRATAALDEAIRTVVASMLEDGRLREGTTGIKLRTLPDRRRA